MNRNDEKRLMAVSEQIVAVGRLARELQIAGHEVEILDLLDALALCNLQIGRPIHSIAGLAYQIVNSVPGTPAYQQLTEIMGGDPQALLADIRQEDES